MTVCPRTTAQDALANGTAFLSRGDILTPTPALDARVLLLSVMGWDHARLIAEGSAEISTTDLDTYQDLLDQRSRGAPIAYLTGIQEFFGLDFHVTEDVLIPRPESELIIDIAQKITPPPRRILDLGTGSGCLIISLLRLFKDALGTAVDISPQALSVAAKNAAEHDVTKRLSLREENFTDPLPTGPYDLIVSNPPYIAEAEELSRSVRAYEPASALYAGTDGLDAYRALAKTIPPALGPEGTVILEIGRTQGPSVSTLFQEALPDAAVTVEKDLAGHPRIVIIRRKS